MISGKIFDKSPGLMVRSKGLQLASLAGSVDSVSTLPMLFVPRDAEDRGKKRHDWIGTLGPNVMGFVEQNC